MGIIDRIKSTFYKADGTPEPQRAIFNTFEDSVYAPISGLLVDLADVRDQAVSSGLLGEGYGIIPSGSRVVYSPVAGRISSTTPTNHSIGVTTADGINVLIHVGIDTVEMKGRGFNRFVEENDEVEAGAPLISFDPEAILVSGHDGVVVCVVSNPESFERIEPVADSGTTIGGHPLVKVGDPLLVVRRS